jgi:membrane protease YdiL (CAAX protease family)
MYGPPIILHLLSHVAGGKGARVRIDFHNTQSLTAYLLLFVVTTKVSEEILYRGLLVPTLRRVGWRDSVICLVSSLILGVYHFIPLGFVFGTLMVGFGAILFAIRPQYDCLSPAWLVHVLFNAQLFLILSLITWLAPAFFPGNLSEEQCFVL